MSVIWRNWPWLAAAALAVAGALGHGGIAMRGRLASGELSTLHAALLFATVWIVSSPRIRRLKALWRASLGRKAVRGVSGGLPSGAPKARAAAGGSVGGAGASASTGPGAPSECVGAGPAMDNFRS